MAAGQADGDRTDDTVHDLGRTPDHDHQGGVGAGGADFVGCGDQFFCGQPLAPLEAPVHLVAAQLLAGQGAELLLDVVEVCFQFGYGTGRQRGHAGHMSHIHHLNPARPAPQQADRGVEGAAGRRGSVIADDKAQIRRGRRGGAHRREDSPCAIARAYPASGLREGRLQGYPGDWGSGAYFDSIVKELACAPPGLPPDALPGYLARGHW